MNFDISSLIHQTYRLAACACLLLVVMASACSGEAPTPTAQPKPDSSADSSDAIIIDSERLNAHVPEGWTRLIDRKVGNLYIAEYYPLEIAQKMRADNENAEGIWQQKLSVEITSGSDLPDPIVFAQAMVDDQSDACDGFSDQPIYTGFENGYPTAVHMLQCPKAIAGKNGLLTILKVIQGNQALYAITLISRAPGAEIPQAVDGEKPPFVQVDIAESEVAAWSNVLKKFSVCDTKLDAHKC